MFRRLLGLEAPEPPVNGHAEPELRAAEEHRAASLDVGAIYGSVFQYGGGGSYTWGVSPAVLAASLSVSDGGSTIITEARRLARVSPLLGAYTRCMEGGVLTGAPERPEFDETVPERVAMAAADAWEAAHDVERERDLLHKVMVDGELLLLDGGQIVPADGYEPLLNGPEWHRTVTAYRIGKATTGRAAGVFYLGDRREGDARAQPWIARALPYASALVSIRVSAGHGLAALSKIAAVIANTSPDRITAGAGARTGVVSDNANGVAGREPITSTGVGSVPYLRPGEAVARIAAGPDEQARKYEAELQAEVAAGLNLPLNELISDYSSGSFSNLRMAWQDAEREYARRRLWWHRHYRLPVWRAVLADAFADNRLPRMRMEDMAGLRKPTWPGPKRQPPQPEKEAQALALLTDKGIYTAAQALEKLES